MNPLPLRPSVAIEHPAVPQLIAQKPPHHIQFHQQHGLLVLDLPAAQEAIVVPIRAMAATAVSVTSCDLGLFTTAR
jgi:hypothetical protein